MMSVQRTYFISTFSMKVLRRVAEMFAILNIPHLFHATVFSASLQWPYRNKNAWVKETRYN